MENPTISKLITSMISKVLITFTALAILQYNSPAQLGPGGTGTVNGYPIGPNVNLKASSPQFLAAGYYHTLAIRKDGSIIAKGWNDYYQSTVPKNLEKAVSVSGGYYHSLASMEDGSVVAWGRNNYGQRDVPEGLGSVVAVSAGHGHSMALKEDGSIVLWEEITMDKFPLPKPY